MTKEVDVLVVGGGPVGACCALSLARRGASVTLVEAGESLPPPRSAAFANCGLIVPSHVLPLAAPGALGQGLRWLLDETSPFYIAPQARWSLVRWLLLFAAAARPERVRAAAPVLAALHEASTRLHAEWAEAPSSADAWDLERRGVLKVFATAQGLEAERRAHDLVAAWARAVEWLDADGVRDRVPHLRGAVAGGVLHLHDGHLDPAAFVRGVAGRAAAAGAEVRRGVEALALRPEGSRVRVLTAAGTLTAGEVVVAAGAWSAPLLAGLGVRLPVEPGRGYSLDVAAGGKEGTDRPVLPLPVHLAEPRVVLTPLADALRAGSTLELAGWEPRVRWRRVAALRAAALAALGLPADTPVLRAWHGLRPLSPDGLPLLGRLPRQPRVVVATGHGMLGLSLAPVTGELVAALLGGEPAPLDLAPLRPDRFGG